MSRPEPVSNVVQEKSVPEAPAAPVVKEEPIVVVTNLNPERFYGPLFRSAHVFHNKKNPLPEEKPEDVHFVSILRNNHREEVHLPTVTTTAKPVVRAAETAAPLVKAVEVVGLRSSNAVLPAAVVATPAPAPPTTTTVAPTTTTTTQAPTTTTTTPAPTTPAAPVTPLRIKSFVVGTNGRIVSSQPTSAPVVAQRQPKALETASRPKGNYQYEGKNYLLTWRNHRNNFDWSGGVQYCRSKGMKMISLDSKEKSEHFLRLVATDRAPYFWAGGKLSRDGRSLSWQNGRTESVARGQHPWSFTGRTGPQPDGGEICLAVLNNVYR